MRIIVLDDSPGREGCEVAASFNDPRILYQPNPANLGAAANIDMGFSKPPMAGGEYFCVLDDDNWLEPMFVSENVRCLKSSGLAVCLRNQEIWKQDAGEPIQINATTRGRWFTEGRVEPIEIYAKSFFTEGISNGGLFWSKDAQSDFFVGSEVGDAGLSECCRTLQVVEPIYFAAKPLAAFSLMSESFRVRAAAANRRFGRGKQAIARFLLSMHGRKIIETARDTASQAGAIDQFRRAMLDAVHPFTAPFVFNGESLSLLAKSTAKLFLVGNPLKTYLHNLSRHREH